MSYMYSIDFDVMVSGNVYGDPSSNPVCILHSANTHWKGMNQTILPPAMGKWWGRQGSLTLAW